MSTKIEWCQNPDGTPGMVWNPLAGCTKVSAGCAHCYAANMASRFSGEGEAFEGTAKGGNWTGRILLKPDKLDEPLHWRKPQRVFVNSMSDLFHEDVPEAFISAVFYVMGMAPTHTFMVLTKRPDRMAEFMDKWTHCDNAHPMLPNWFPCPASADKPVGYGHFRRTGETRTPLSNVWLGVSVENQKAADERIPWLLKTPAAVRFLSCEPLLGPVDLLKILSRLVGDKRQPCPCFGGGGCSEHWCAWPACIGTEHLHWVIAGCESGPKRRPAHERWFRMLRLDCEAAAVPFFLKQMEVDGELVKMPELDGVEHNAFPEVAA